MPAPPTSVAIVASSADDMASPTGRPRPPSYGEPDLPRRLPVATSQGPGPPASPATSSLRAPSRRLAGTLQAPCGHLPGALRALCRHLAGQPARCGPHPSHGRGWDPGLRGPGPAWPDRPRSMRQWQPRDEPEARSFKVASPQCSCSPLKAEWRIEPLCTARGPPKSFSPRRSPRSLNRVSSGWAVAC